MNKLIIIGAGLAVTLGFLVLNRKRSSRIRGNNIPNLKDGLIQSCDGSFKINTDKFNAWS